MNASIITRALLLARGPLLAAMGTSAAARIIIGIIPSGVSLPAIGITEVSATEHVPLTGSSRALVTSRIQVSVAAASVKEAKDILAQVKYACRNFIGPAAGVSRVKAQLLDTGPDFEHEAGFAMQSQDVRVTFMDVPGN